jgi:hypothetical protein
MAQEGKDVTPFGTVTSGDLVYIARQGWSRHELRKTIPLHHVTSVKLEIKRYPILATLLVLVALACWTTGSTGAPIAVVPLLVAVLLFWGLPSVRVNTVEGDLPSATRPPWTRPEAEWFVVVVDRRRSGIS